MPVAVVKVWDLEGTLHWHWSRETLSPYDHVWTSECPCAYYSFLPVLFPSFCLSFSPLPLPLLRFSAHSSSLKVGQRPEHQPAPHPHHQRHLLSLLPAPPDPQSLPVVPIQPIPSEFWVPKGRSAIYTSLQGCGKVGVAWQRSFLFLYFPLLTLF